MVADQSPACRGHETCADEAGDEPEYLIAVGREDPLDGESVGEGEKEKKDLWHGRLLWQLLACQWAPGISDAVYLDFYI